MDFSNAIREAGRCFLYASLINLFCHLIDKHDKGEFNYRNYTNYSYVAFAVAGMVFVIVLIGGLIKK